MSCPFVLVNVSYIVLKIFFLEYHRLAGHEFSRPSRCLPPDVSKIQFPCFHEFCFFQREGCANLLRFVFLLQ